MEMIINLYDEGLFIRCSHILQRRKNLTPSSSSFMIFLSSCFSFFKEAGFREIGDAVPVVVEGYIGFGGIRIEDDIVITREGCKVIGEPIAKEVADVETACAAK